MQSEPTDLLTLLSGPYLGQISVDYEREPRRMVTSMGPNQIAHPRASRVA